MSRRPNCAVDMTRLMRRTSIVIALACAALHIAGCAELPAASKVQLSQARNAYDAGDFARCAQLVEPIINEHPKNPQTAEAFYLRGLSRLRQHNRSESLEDFRKGESLARDPLLKALLDVQIANFAFDDDLFDQAAVRYGRAIKNLPNAPPTDAAYYRHGLSLIRSGKFADGRKFLTELATRYPSSEFVKPAARALAWDGDYLTVQCGSFNNMDLAHRAAADLRRQSFDALAYPDPTSSFGRYVVRIGRFRTYSEARGVLNRVRAQVPDAFVLP